jgi:hypothetical protein
MNRLQRPKKRGILWGDADKVNQYVRLLVSEFEIHRDSSAGVHF